MHLTKYQVVPANGGWRVVSSLGRTRFDGQVFCWTDACRLRERLAARQAEIYGVADNESAAASGEVVSNWPAARPRAARPQSGVRSTH